MLLTLHFLSKKKKIIYLAVWVLVVAYEIFHCVWIL